MEMQAFIALGTARGDKSISVKELTTLLETLPPEANVVIQHHQDRRGIRAEWETQTN